MRSGRKGEFKRSLSKYCGHELVRELRRYDLHDSVNLN